MPPALRFQAILSHLERLTIPLHHFSECQKHFSQLQAFSGWGVSANARTLFPFPQSAIHGWQDHQHSIATILATARTLDAAALVEIPMNFLWWFLYKDETSLVMYSYLPSLLTSTQCYQQYIRLGISIASLLSFTDGQAWMVLASLRHLGVGVDLCSPFGF